MKVAFCTSSNGTIANKGCFYPEYGFLITGGKLFLGVEHSYYASVNYLLICQTPINPNNAVTFEKVSADKILGLELGYEKVGVRFGTP